MQARLALDESLAPDQACWRHPEPPHHRLRGVVAHLGEGNDRCAGLVLVDPGERRPPDLSGIAAAGQRIPDDLAELEHGFTVEVEPGEPAASDQRPIITVAGHPLADTVRPPAGGHSLRPRASTYFRLHGPVQNATRGSP